MQIDPIHTVKSGIKLSYNLVEEVFILGEEYNSTPAVVVHY